MAFHTGIDVASWRTMSVARGTNYDLPAGDNIIRVYQREDGTLLDQLACVAQ